MDKNTMNSYQSAMIYSDPYTPILNNHIQLAKSETDYMRLRVNSVI